MREDITAIFVAVDGSDSMNQIKHGIIDGFNEFIKQQNTLPGSVYFSMVQFHTVNTQHGSQEFAYDVLYNFKNLKEVTLLNDDSYKPSGMTPLLDGLDRGIDEFGQRLSDIPEAERPSRVVFVIVSDGLENASKRATKAGVAAKIKHQSEVYNWQFVYLGANQDAFSEARGLEIRAAAARNYDATYSGVVGGIKGMSGSVMSYRTGQTQEVKVNEEQKS